MGGGKPLGWAGLLGCEELVEGGEELFERVGFGEQFDARVGSEVEGELGVVGAGGEDSVFCGSLTFSLVIEREPPSGFWSGVICGLRLMSDGAGVKRGNKSWSGQYHSGLGAL
jgi:hypothetical protein